MPDTRTLPAASASPVGLYRSRVTDPEQRRHITVGRDALLADTLDILKHGLGKPPKHHLLFIGPRGIGKTHLLALIEDEIGRDAGLSAGYHVVRFPEESHRLLSFADILLGICEILRDTLPEEPEWHDLHERLCTEQRAEVIVDTLVPAIRQRWRSRRQALVLMLENLHEVFGPQIKDPLSIAAVRGFLMQDNGCLLVATAPLHFGAVTDHRQPFYDFFDVQILDQLTDEQTIELVRRNLQWEGRADLLAEFDNLRPRLLALYRMTGGNPRLTLMLYELIAHEAVSEVKRQFEMLLDRITPFYQDRMRDLGPQERAVLETMALMRDEPKTPTAIAARMRVKSAQLSSLLNRLQKAHYLRAVDNPADKRSRFYTIREGFFDIWLAMNVSRGARRRLPFLVDFFAQFYPSIELRNRKREEYRRRLASGEFDAPEGTHRAEDLREGLDLLSGGRYGSGTCKREASPGRDPRRRREPGGRLPARGPAAASRSDRHLDCQALRAGSNRQLPERDRRPDRLLGIAPRRRSREVRGETESAGRRAFVPVVVRDETRLPSRPPRPAARRTGPRGNPAPARRSPAEFGTLGRGRGATPRGHGRGGFLQ